MLALSVGPNRVRVSPPSPEVGNRSSFRNVVFSSVLKYRTMNKVQASVILIVVHHRQNPLESNKTEVTGRV
jgi:hypothetical protein